MTDIVVRQW